MGPYNNVTGRYLPSDDWKNGQWLISQDGTLYVIPLDADDVEGPDDDTADLILQFLGTDERLDDADIANLELTEVSPALKRFDPAIGYYSA